ncbi:nitrogen fixation protein NifU [candidate division MSBL1 archaeon SCGC-AAA259E19]|uniref:Nitrogen fixation protein NifU n=2 Tax=candidate division MSBL1 TaxID=215777 RepID=A0A133V5R5_9EURY|nr:nitrogen fixation protein NifU [candidate division MSBL1 archaeon SCGC-AAA259E19]KXB01783.1 nitrogen fixation protein NifU [candidate division MSBL1 archaeon SCGC-AAA259O05]
MDYSDKIIELFENPKNVGELEDADVTVQEGDPTCGDTIQLSLKFENDVIKDAKFLSFGCASNIATASQLTEMIKNKTIDEARGITVQDVEEEVGGLPSVKMHCAVLATNALEKALQKALDEYEERKSEK